MPEETVATEIYVASTTTGQRGNEGVEGANDYVDMKEQESIFGKGAGLAGGERSADSEEKFAADEHLKEAQRHAQNAKKEAKDAKQEAKDAKKEAKEAVKAAKKELKKRN